MVKPDGVQRSLVGEIVKRFEQVGLKIIALKMLVPTNDIIEKHYTLDPAWLMNVGKKTIAGFVDKGLTPPSNDPMVLAQDTLNRLKKYLTSGPVVAFVLEGPHAATLVRKLVGGTEPLTSDVGTIRGDFVVDSYQLAALGDRAVRNLVHASGSAAEAEGEINLWFRPEEIIAYRHINEAILSDVNLDGISE